MKYVRDTAADALVLGDAKLRELVQGHVFVAWLPGQGAMVATQACLTAGWAFTCLSFLGFRHIDSDHMAVAYAATMVFAGVKTLVFYRLARGSQHARAHAFRLACSMVALASVAAIGGFAFGHARAGAIGVGAVSVNLTATILLAGRHCALLAAIYRAQREHMAKPRQPTRQRR
jgi:hypothetical protein